MRADRLLSILLTLQIRGQTTARHLAETLEVSERTIYRDLDALSAAGIPVYAERGPGGGCALSEGYRTNLTGLSADEVRTLFFAALPGPLADLGLGKALKEAHLKLLAALPLGRQHDAERFRQRILLDPAGWFVEAEPVPYLPLLQEAVWTDQRVRMHYRRGDRQEIERVIEPLGLVAKTNIWYLAGAAEGQTRIYRVSRILTAELTGEVFDRPPDFDLAARWAEWVSDFDGTRKGYHATVRFAPGAIPILPRVLGEWVRAKSETAALPDAEGWITLSLVFENITVACYTLLNFGVWAEVIDPPELRAEIVAAAGRVIAFYASRDGGE